ncbi:MAG: hypothetical protein AB1730_19560 [Myxococcota bacterium]
MQQRRLVLLGSLFVALGLAWWLVGRRPVPVLEKPSARGCEGCHQVTGLEASHVAIGCAACHLGQPDAGSSREAHAGLVRIPGNAADMQQTCGAGTCHPAVPLRLANNVMETMAGVVSVDRWVFGEQPSPTGGGGVATVGHSAADTHLRNLCVSCHLGAVKDAYGPVGGRSRGGGCLACHLKYPEPARAALTAYEAADDAGRGAALSRFVHPQLRARVDDEHCFGCHSRSGRVALNIQGLTEANADGGAPVRTLEDGRRLYAAPADVHHERGLSCTDCHGSWEVMGDGRLANHREDQAVVQCSDCHRADAPVTVDYEGLDQESKKLVGYFGLDAPGRRYALMERRPYPLLGVEVRDGGVRAFQSRFTGREHPLAPPAPACTGTHARVGCPACHDAWAPQCVGCHTRFDPADVMFDWKARAEAPGAWLEEPGPMFSEPGALGVRTLEDGGSRFEAFIPGMVLTIDFGDGGTRFRRLYAPIAAHTVRREARSCESCHADPLALGWGRGTIAFQRSGNRWTPRFTPRFPRRAEDGLPQDAWIGVFAARGAKATTRTTTRPLSPDEQRRVVDVGACLRCHPGDSAVMQRALADRRLPTPSAGCRQAWNR